MCLFSRWVEEVAGTQIFCRGLDDQRQAIVYQMSLESAEPVAMVLPVPVPPGGPESAIEFVALDSCRDFFDQLHELFEDDDDMATLSVDLAETTTLAVEVVGDYVASYVPSHADWHRLDPRFRLPSGVWDALPRYADYGFVVFQLRPGAGRTTFHPMAFTLPRRDPATLFFPTVHVHDGHWHSEANFDHTLSFQLSAAEQASLVAFGPDEIAWVRNVIGENRWDAMSTNERNLQMRLQTALPRFTAPMHSRAHGALKAQISNLKVPGSLAAKSTSLIRSGEHCLRLSMKSRLLNEDVVLRESAA